MKLLAFATDFGGNGGGNEKRIESFDINTIGVKFSYQPIVLANIGVDSNLLSLKGHKLKLSAQQINNVNGIGNLAKIVSNRWLNEIHPTNILQFVPNIGIVKPYTMPVVRIITMINKFFNKRENKNKLRLITRNLAEGYNFISVLVKSGIDQAYDLFN